MNMYTEHFGLKILPFENVPDPLFFFDQGDHARVHNSIKESLKVGRGLMIVTGPIGSGKTTLSQKIKSGFSRNIKLIWMAVPPDNDTDLFLFIAQELGLKPATSEKVFVIREIKDALLKSNSEGSKCLLIIDELRLMTNDVLNGINLLNELKDGSTKLIQILLLCQEEFMGSINTPEMEPFKQRISTLEILGKMYPDIIYDYILHRIHVAGGHPSIFTDTGWEAVVLASDAGGGTPRMINLLCDRALQVAFERDKKAVDVDDVYEAAKGMGLEKEEFFYKIALKQVERMKEVSFHNGNGCRDDFEIHDKESIELFNKKSDETDIKNINRTSKISQSIMKKPETGFPIFGIDQNSLKDLCRSFLRRMFRSNNGKPAEINETVISLKESKTAAKEEADISYMDQKSSINEKKTPHSSEVITSNTEGERLFKPDDVREEKLKKEEKSASKIDDWVTADTKNPGEFKINDVEDKKSREAQETATASVWVTIDKKGTRTFNPDNGTGKKPAENKETAAKLDEWITTGTKKN
ncbi:MAG: AAA family ATPase [Nitrospirae bacterium]|nr:AAA family ATPase [Nitrospirota bacterium]